MSWYTRQRSHYLYRSRGSQRARLATAAVEGSLVRTVIAVWAMLIVLPRFYVDPTAGGMLLQLILGGSLLSVIWRVVRVRFSRRREPPA